MPAPRRLRALQERDLAAEDVVAVVLDGKTPPEAAMVIALGITLSGENRFHPLWRRTQRTSGC